MNVPQTGIRQLAVSITSGKEFDLPAANLYLVWLNIQILGVTTTNGPIVAYEYIYLKDRKTKGGKIFPSA